MPTISSTQSAQQQHVLVQAKAFKTPAEVMGVLVESAVYKSNLSVGQASVLGFLSGIYVVFGGALALFASLGLPGYTANNPALPQLLNGLTFPIALMLIVVGGGELFTGNIMYFCMALLHRKAYFTNYAGCVFGAYFYCYLTNLYEAEPYLSGIQALAVKKTHQGFGVLFLKGMAANQLVDIAIIFVVASQDVTSKLLSSWFVIGLFAACGFEHCIANHFYLTVSLMYGAPVGYGYTIYKNMIPVLLGNFTGAALLVALALWYTYLYPSVKTTNAATDELSTQQQMLNISTLSHDSTFKNNDIPLSVFPACSAPPSETITQSNNGSVSNSSSSVSSLSSSPAPTTDPENRDEVLQIL